MVGAYNYNPSYLEGEGVTHSTRRVRPLGLRRWSSIEGTSKGPDRSRGGGVTYITGHWVCAAGVV